MKNIKIAPSILAADFLQLGDEINKIKEAGIEMLHFDIMDGNFVPNISFGIDFFKSIKKAIDIESDVHLMVNKPNNFISQFAEAGADIITFHREVTDFPIRTIKMIKEYGKKAGISLNPATCIETIEDILGEIDLVLIMSVEPGFYGQKFIPFVLDKIKKLNAIIEKNRYSTLIEVDGGVNNENLSSISEAGADIVVMGKAFFK